MEANEITVSTVYVSLQALAAGADPRRPFGGRQPWEVFRTTCSEEELGRVPGDLHASSGMIQLDSSNDRDRLPGDVRQRVLNLEEENKVRQGMVLGVEA